MITPPWRVLWRRGYNIEGHNNKALTVNVDEPNPGAGNMRGLFAAIAGAALGLLPALVHAEELKVGNVYRTSVKILDTMGDVNLPLPEGEWKLIGLGKSASRYGEIPFLKGQLVSTALDSAKRPRAFIIFSVASAPSMTGWAQPPVCARKDLNFVYPEDPRQNIGGGQINCWAVHPVHMLPNENAEPWLVDAFKWTGTNTAGMPLTTITADFVRASGFKFVAASYMFNPEAQGFKRLAFTAWDRTRIISEKKEVDYVELIHQFAIAWSPKFERGFAGRTVAESDVVLPDNVNPLRYAAIVAAATGASRPTDIKNVNAVPYLADQGRQNYANFLKRKSPRAFAISSAGGYGWSSGGNGKDNVEHALANCNARSDVPCKLYALDDKIVWDGK